MYRFHGAVILLVWFTFFITDSRSQVVVSNTAEDPFDGDDECSMPFFGVLDCVLTNGLNLSYLVADACGVCVSDAIGQDTSQYSCDDLVSHVGEFMDECQEECALPLCTPQLTTLMKCLTVKSSQCGQYTSRPTTESPTRSPTRRPTPRPTRSPTRRPTRRPTTAAPSSAPSEENILTNEPTSEPSRSPQKNLRKDSGGNTEATAPSAGSFGTLFSVFQEVDTTNTTTKDP